MKALPFLARFANELVVHTICLNCVAEDAHITFRYAVN